MRRKRVDTVPVSAHVRHMSCDPEPVVVVRIIVWGGRKGEEILHEESRTIAVRELAGQLYGDDMPKPGDMFTPREPAE